jgi:hypothetical protein
MGIFFPSFLFSHIVREVTINMLQLIKIFSIKELFLIFVGISENSFRVHYDLRSKETIWKKTSLNIQSNLFIATTLGTIKKWSLSRGGRYSVKQLNI